MKPRQVQILDLVMNRVQMLYPVKSHVQILDLGGYRVQILDPVAKSLNSQPVQILDPVYVVVFVVKKNYDDQSPACGRARTGEPVTAELA